MSKVWKNLWPFLWIAAATLLVGRDWWNDWLLGGHSAFMDYFRMVVLDDAVRQGDWWPRFAEAFYYGHGSLLFHFYAPLTYWLSELFVLLGASIPVAIKLTLGLSIFLSGLFVGLLARELYGPWAAAFAGVLYVLAPYHLTDVLGRHAFGEAVAFAWLPLALWGILGAVRDGSAWRMAAGAIGAAFLLLTHNITAMISAPLLFAWWLYLSVRYFHQGWRGPLLGALAGVFGVLLAAFFWLPAFAETDQVWSKRSLTSEYFIYWKHFVFFRQFFSLYWGHGGSFEGYKDSMSFQLGLAHWLALAAAVPVFIARKAWRNPMIFWAVALLISLVMCHAVSLPVWQLIPILEFVQFPWRFLLLAALAASLLVAPVAQWVAEQAPEKWRAWLAAMVVLLPFLAYYPYTYSKFLLLDTKKGDHHRFRVADYPRRAKQKRYERLEKTVDINALRQQNVNATARDDFLPVGVIKKPRETADPAVVIEPETGTVTAIDRLGPRHYRATVSLVQDGTVYLNRFWYRGWEAELDGRPATTFADSPQGLVAVRVPAGEHRLEFSFGTTPLRRFAWWLTLGGVVGLIAVVLLGAFWPRRSNPAAAAS
ncbi:MAG: hypothetical protein GX444_07430 [Myxococcales bacterium]|nr:hypothetical protein [Myxococcales bacterium]